MDDRELLLAVLARDDQTECLTGAARKAFTQWRDEGRGEGAGHGYPFTDAQLNWLRGVAERLGIATAPSENLFSNLSPERQAEQRRAASKVRLPWEKE
jgi:hypothetical protein